MLQWIKHNNQKILRTTVILQIAVVIFVLLFYFTPAQAAEVTPGPQQGAALDTAATGIQYAGQIGLGGDDIRTIVASIIRIALGLIGIILVVLMMYAGFLWMTAGGNDEQIVRAKSILRNAVIGLAIVLSAYSIVLFVMKMLGIGEGGGETPVEISGPNTQNFQGSGALGAVIKDHYPVRNQEEVPRNVKIVVTFRRPVLLSSFVEEHSGNNVLGDCRDKGAEAIVWKDDCDQLIMNNNLINISRVVQNGNQFVLQPLENGAVVLAASTEIGGIKGVYTIVIRPNDLLGSSAEKFTYLVHLGRGLLLDDPANPNLSVFSVKVMGNDYYEWQFSCCT